jgi:acyl carrier protein
MASKVAVGCSRSEHDVVLTDRIGRTMGPPNNQQLDIDALVREHFQQYLGSIEGLPLESQVIADAGVDSILLVMILTDLFVQLNLDVGDAEVKLADIQTLADVADLVRAMLESEPVPS